MTPSVEANSGKPKRKMRLWLVLAAFSILVIAVWQPFGFKLSKDLQKFRQQIRERIPTGTSTAMADAEMAHLGFTKSKDRGNEFSYQRESDGQWDKASGPNFAVYFKYDQGLITFRLWRVAFATNGIGSVTNDFYQTFWDFRAMP